MNKTDKDYINGIIDTIPKGVPFSSAQVSQYMKSVGNGKRTPSSIETAKVIRMREDVERAYHERNVQYYRKKGMAEC